MHMAYCSGGVCLPFTPDKLFQDVRSPVGALETRNPRPAGNFSADVKTVQNLLNQIAPADGGTRGTGRMQTGLKPDGICGPLTRAAIVEFQKRQFPQFRSDGIVDPTKRTVNRLNVLAHPQVDFILLAKGRAAIAKAANYVLIAMTRLQLVDTHLRRALGGGALFNYESHVKVCNAHFHLDRSTDALRDLHRILDVFRLMHTVTAHVPAGPNQKPAFGFLDFMPVANTQKEIPFAYTTPGGYLYLQGVEGTRDNAIERGDTIYLTRALLDLQEPAVVYAIIHEMAHFVGGRRGDIDHIRDHAYFHRQKPKYDRLNAYEASTNADSFSQYVWEVNTGQHMNPDLFRI